MRIADFGLARALAEAAWTEPDGAILGTARYAAPEQVEGWTLDGRADVYSLALVLYEGVTGKVPFAGDTTVATLMARVGTLLPEHEALGPLNEVLVWAAAPEPDERYDAAALILRLQALEIALPDPEPLVLAEAAAVIDPSRAEPARVGAGTGGRTRSDGDATELGVATALLSPEKPVGKPRGVTEPPAPGSGDPSTRRRWPWKAGISAVAVALVAAGLVLGFRQQLFTPSHPVPSLVGKTVPVAVNAVAADHFKVHQSGAQFSTTAVPGVILSQQPAAKSGGNRCHGQGGDHHRGGRLQGPSTGDHPRQPDQLPELCRRHPGSRRRASGRGLPGQRRPVQFDGAGRRHPRLQPGDQRHLRVDGDHHHSPRAMPRWPSHR